MWLLAFRIYSSRNVQSNVCFFLNPSQCIALLVASFALNFAAIGVVLNVNGFHLFCMTSLQ